MNVQFISNASNPKRITSWMTSSPDKSWRSVLTDAPSSGYGLDEASCRFGRMVLIQIKQPAGRSRLARHLAERCPNFARRSCHVRMLPTMPRMSTCAMAAC